MSKRTGLVEIRIKGGNRTSLGQPGYYSEKYNAYLEPELFVGTPEEALDKVSGYNFVPFLAWAVYDNYPNFVPIALDYIEDVLKELIEGNSPKVVQSGMIFGKVAKHTVSPQ